MMDSNRVFFELLQIVLGTRNGLTAVPGSRQDWEDVFAVGARHNLLSVTFPVIDRLHDEVDIPLGIYSRWAMLAEKVTEKNKYHLECCKMLTERLLAYGYRSCILKGQGVAAMYPTPSLRQSGDIDIWVEGGHKKIVGFLREHFKVGHVVYHHCEVRMFKGFNVEVHFTPSWMNGPCADRRLQKYFSSHARAQFDNYDSSLGFSVPTPRFQAVHLLLHIYRHVLDEGVGLRQLMDYSILLRRLEDKDREEALKDIRFLKLDKFAAGLMAVLAEVFGLDERDMLCKPDSRQGRFLLDEIMVSGNFGRYDVRNAHSADETRVMHAKRKMTRSLRYLKYYPSEVLSIPVFMVRHYFWRLFNGYLKKV